jgi:pilus assembly protein TadC
MSEEWNLRQNKLPVRIGSGFFSSISLAIITLVIFVIAGFASNRGS